MPPTRLIISYKLFLLVETFYSIVVLIWMHKSIHPIPLIFYVFAHILLFTVLATDRRRLLAESMLIRRSVISRRYQDNITYSCQTHTPLLACVPGYASGVLKFPDRRICYAEKRFVKCVMSEKWVRRSHWIFIFCVFFFLNYFILK